MLAEFPRGLAVRRDYDTSIPEFRGDREQLIQAVLNIAHNATQALGERIAAGDAQLVLRTRIARQVTFGQAALSPGTGIAYRGQRARRARGHPRSHLPPAGVGARGRIGARADAGADLRAATPGHDRMRQRSRAAPSSRSSSRCPDDDTLPPHETHLDRRRRSIHPLRAREGAAARTVRRAQLRQRARRARGAGRRRAAGAGQRHPHARRLRHRPAGQGQAAPARACR